MANFFSVPDKDKNYQGYMVSVLAIIWFLVTGIVVSMGFFLIPGLWLRWIVLLFISFFIAAGNLSLIRFGYTRFASWSLTIMLWLYITLPCYSAGGIMAPGILMQISVILTAGFLLGGRGGIFFGLLTIGTDFWFAYLELTGHLPVPSVEYNPVTRWVANIISFGAIISLQYFATHHLRRGLAVMKLEMDKREETEKWNKQLLYNLGERVKELKTLYTVNHILQDEDAPHPNLMNQIVELLPSGWQYPDITAARIRIDEKEFATRNFQPSIYSQEAEMKTASGSHVFIEVVYLQTMQESDEGPFLQEERNLINMLVEMLKIDLERRERKAELKDYKYALDIAASVSISTAIGNFVYVNDNFCKISKYSPEELSGRHHSIIWSGLHTPEYFEELKISMQNGIPYRGEFCNRAKDGSLFWVDSSIVPFLDDKGKVYQYLSINHDITNRKEAENAIIEQAETFRAIVENTKESIYLISPEFKLLQFNSTAKERIQTTRGMELKLGADFRNYLFPGNTDIFYTMFEDALQGRYRTKEIKAKGIADHHFWFQSKTSPVYNLNGQLIGVRLLTEPLDDKKKAEAILRESEEKFRSIVEQSLVGIFIIQHNKFVYVNPGFEKIFAFSQNELLHGMSFENLVYKDDIDLVKNSYNNRINRKSVNHQYVFRGIRKDGAILHLEIIASLISYNEEPAIIGTLVNITDRIEEERRINQAVLDAQEKERLQIGMELHDNVKQILAGSGIFLDIARNKLDDKVMVTKILDDLKKYNTDAITELRRLSHQLAPSVEEDTILEDKIHWLLKSLKLNESVSVSLHIDDFEKPLDNNTQLNFYRILQEQLSNIIKYAKASTIDVNVRLLDQTISLQIKDNGIGFDVSAKKEGIGLENIRRRVQMLNGKFEIYSFPGGGCEINVEIPI